MSFVIVQVYTNYIDANIIMGRLEEEGVNCWLKDENTVTMNPMLTNAIGGIKLMVAESQAQRAFELLREFKNDQAATLKCLRCGSSNIELVTTPRKASNWVWVIFGFFFGNYAMAGDKVYHCFDCSYESAGISEENNDVVKS